MITFFGTSLQGNANQYKVSQTLIIQHENFALVVDKLLKIILSLQLEAFKKQLMKSLSEDNLLVSIIDQKVSFPLIQDY